MNLRVEHMLKKDKPEILPNQLQWNELHTILT